MRSVLKFLFWAAVGLVAVYVIGRLFFFDVYQLEHNDMAPTLVAGDQVMVYRHATPELGDVVVCDDPTDAQKRVVGRVVGVPGTTVAVERGLLRINGVVAHTEGAAQNRYHLIDAPNHGDYDLVRVRELLGNNPHDFVTLPNRAIEMHEHRVRQGLFLLSDNRAYGRDSRHYGEVAASSCHGRVVIVLFPGSGTGDSSTARRTFSWID